MSMMGVRLPPMEAGSVGAGASRSMTRPLPLNNIPANGERRSTGFFAGTIAAVLVSGFSTVPAAGSWDSTSRTVARGPGAGQTGPGPLAGVPMRNMRSRRWATVQFSEFSTTRSTR